jgi:hypothetical protein
MAQHEQPPIPIALLHQFLTCARAAFTEDLRSIVRSEMRAVLAERTDQDAPAPLHKILNITPGAARKRAQKDRELAELGIRLGGRTLYRPSDVNALLARRRVAKAPSLHLVEGGR